MSVYGAKSGDMTCMSQQEHDLCCSLDIPGSSQWQPMDKVQYSNINTTNVNIRYEFEIFGIQYSTNLRKKKWEFFRSEGYCAFSTHDTSTTRVLSITASCIDILLSTWHVWHNNEYTGCWRRLYFLINTEILAITSNCFEHFVFTLRWRQTAILTLIEIEMSHCQCSTRSTLRLT